MSSLGSGSSIEFFTEEMSSLCLRDKRLNARAKRLLVGLQSQLGSCIRRVFTNKNEARQAYDFF